MTPTKPDAVRWLLDLRDRALEWVARQPTQAETETYARLMFAFALARIGAGEEARAALTEALARVPALEAVEYGFDAGFDAAHESLRAAFRFRIEEALTGRPPSRSFPEPLLLAAERLERLPRYVVDRLRNTSAILEPGRRVNPYRHWGAGINDFERALAELRDMTDSDEIRSRVALLLSLAKGLQGASHRVWHAVLAHNASPDEDLVSEAVIEIVASLKGPASAGDDAEIGEEIERLVLALRQAGHRHLNSLMPSLIEAARVWCLYEAEHLRIPMSGVISASVEAMWELRLGEEADSFLNEISTAFAGMGAINKRGLLRLTALLAVVDGWFRFGWDRLTERVFSAAYAALASDQVGARDLQRVACDVAFAVRSAPVSAADECFRRLFGSLPGIRDTYTTSTHFSVSVLMVVEAVCLSAAEVAGRMMHE